MNALGGLQVDRVWGAGGLSLRNEDMGGARTESLWGGRLISGRRG